MKCPSCRATLPAEDLECTRCGAHVGWFVKSPGAEETGPYTFVEMQTMVRQEQISPLDQFRIGLIGEWRPAPEILRPQYAAPPASAGTEGRAASPRPRKWRVGLPVTVGGLLLVILVVTGAVVSRIRTGSTHRSASRACLVNVRHLASALQMYANDNNGVLPDWQAWGPAALGYLNDPDGLRCPAAPMEPGYAYNALLGGVPLERVSLPVECAILWDAGALGPSMGLTTGYSAPRHHGGDNYGFADGHSAWRKRGAQVRTQVELQPEETWPVRKALPPASMRPPGTQAGRGSAPR